MAESTSEFLPYTGAAHLEGLPGQNISPGVLPTCDLPDKGKSTECRKSVGTPESRTHDDGGAAAAPPFGPLFGSCSLLYLLDSRRRSAVARGRLRARLAGEKSARERPQSGTRGRRVHGDRPLRQRDDDRPRLFGDRRFLDFSLLRYRPNQLRHSPRHDGAFLTPLANNLPTYRQLGGDVFDGLKYTAAVGGEKGMMPLAGARPGAFPARRVQAFLPRLVGFFPPH
jgi:hypothetical protein